MDVAIKDLATGLWWNGSGWGSHRWLPSALTTPDAPRTDWTFAWSSPPSGSYAVQARALDLIGNSSTKPWVLFSITQLVDAANPSLSITSPKTNRVLSSPAVTETGAASDDTGVARVDMAIKNVSTGQWWTGSGWGVFHLAACDAREPQRHRHQLVVRVDGSGERGLRHPGALGGFGRQVQPPAMGTLLGRELTELVTGRRSMCPDRVHVGDPHDQPREHR